MKLLTAILLLISTTCFGALPDYKAFRGTGGITVTSNPPIGTIVIDGSGISSPTGGVSATTVSNIVLSKLDSSTNALGYGFTNLLTGASLYLDAVNGSDATAKRGDASKPWATASNFFKAIQNGDTAIIRPGVYGANSPQGTWAIPCIGLTNLTNILIVGSGPGTIITNGNLGTLMNFRGCSNVLMSDLQLHGIRTNGQIAAIYSAIEILDTNWNITFQRVAFKNFQDQAIGGNLGGGGPFSYSINVLDSWFYNIGNTNTITLGQDGAADSCFVSGSHVSRNHFYNCARLIENFGDGVTVNAVFTDNTADETLETAIFLGGGTGGFTNVIIANNTIRGTIAANTGVRIGARLDSFNDSIIANNVFSDFQAGVLGDGNRAAWRGMNNVRIQGNIFRNMMAGGVAITTPVGVNFKSSRIAVHNNTFDMIGGAAVNIGGGNGNSVNWNNILNTGTNGGGNYAIYVGQDTYATNSTNFSVIGNVIEDTGAAFTDGAILIAASAVNTMVFNNRTTFAITDNGINTLAAAPVAGQVLTAVGNSGLFSWSNSVGASTATLNTASNFLYTHTMTMSSNNVRVVAGTNAFVSASGAGGVMTYAVSATGYGNVSSNNAGGITAIGLSTNQSDLYVAGELSANNITANGASGFINPNWAGNFIMQSDFSDNSIQESPLSIFPLRNLMAMGITNLLAADNIALGTNNGVLWITNTAPGSGTASSNLSYVIGANATNYANALRGLVISTNGGALNTVTQVIARSGIVVSNDATGTASFHVTAGAGGGNVSSNVAGGITAIGLSTNQSDLHAQGAVVASGLVGFVRPGYLNGEIIVSDMSTGELIESGTSLAALEVNLNAASNVVFTFANAIRGLVISTNGGALNTVTQVIARSGIVVSNDAVGTASLHVTGGAGASGVLSIGSNDVIYPATNINFVGNKHITNANGKISVAYTLDDLTDVVMPTTADNYQVLTYIGGVWTNEYAFFAVTYNVTLTNVYVGTNMEQSISIKTNASFVLVYTGTPRNGETVNLSVSNYSASTIYMTNSSLTYDTTVASNVTLFAIAGNSIRNFTFVNNTNHNLGVARWELRNNLGKEYELAVAGSLTIHTNANLITLSNSTASGSGNYSTNADGSAVFTNQNSITLAQFNGHTNGYAQVKVKNWNTGASVSSDFVAEADNGDESTNYIDFGINGSGGGGAPFTNGNAGYLYTYGDDLHIGALNTNKSVRFYAATGLGNSTLPKFIITGNQIGHGGQLIVLGTNYPGASNAPSLIISNAFTAPSNTVQGSFIAFDTSTFSTGTGGTNFRPRGEFGYIPTIAAAGTHGGTWVFQSRTNENGSPTTNMTLTSVGLLTTAGSIVSGGSVTVPSGSTWATSSRGNLFPRSDGVWSFRNAAGLDFSTLEIGGNSQSNSLIQIVSSSAGNSNSIIRLRSGNTTSYLILEVGELRATNSISLTNGALIIGPSGAAITNILSASATLDFPSTLAQTDSDLPITVTGAAPGDVVQLGTPTIPLTGSTYTAFASNDTVFVRFSVYGLAAKDPASGTFKVIVTKF